MHMIQDKHATRQEKNAAGMVKIKDRAGTQANNGMLMQMLTIGDMWQSPDRHYAASGVAKRMLRKALEDPYDTMW